MTLTAKQARILECIERVMAETGRPPTYREIAKDLGLSAVGTVQDHVRALKQKGYLTQAKGRSHARELLPTHQSQARSIPILGTVPAGNPIEAIEDRQGALSLAHPRGRKAGAVGAECFALRVRGDSMVNAGILDGDYVIVERASDTRHGEIVVALIDGEATVKRLESRAGRIRLLPENPKYEPIELRAGLENTIQGRVISVQRFLG